VSKDLYYTIPRYFLERMHEHSNVRRVENVSTDEFFLYRIYRLRQDDSVLVCYLTRTDSPIWISRIDLASSPLATTFWSPNLKVHCEFRPSWSPKHASGSENSLK